MEIDVYTVCVDDNPIAIIGYPAGDNTQSH